MTRISDSLAIGIPGGSEWLLILLVILILFGGAKIPELMRSFGKGVGELQKGIDEGKRHFEEAKEEVRLDRPSELPESTSSTTTS